MDEEVAEDLVDEVVVVVLADEEVVVEDLAAEEVVVEVADLEAVVVDVDLAAVVVVVAGAAAVEDGRFYPLICTIVVLQLKPNNYYIIEYICVMLIQINKIKRIFEEKFVCYFIKNITICFCRETSF